MTLSITNRKFAFVLCTMYETKLNHFESKGETNLVSSEEVRALLVSNKTLSFFKISFHNITIFNRNIFWPYFFTFFLTYKIKRSNTTYQHIILKNHSELNLNFFSFTKK